LEEETDSKLTLSSDIKLFPLLKKKAEDYKEFHINLNAVSLQPLQLCMTSKVKSPNCSKVCELMDSALVGKGHRTVNKEDYKQS